MSKLFEFDQKIRKAERITNIVGLDEAGRGPLAGPVATAAVVLPKDYQNEMINDSKKLTDKERRILFEEIKKVAVAYRVILVPVETIDEINILEADRKGMQECLKDIEDTIDVEYVITDYMNLKTVHPLLSIAKGDATSLSVAAASILAKVTRDDYMIKISEKYPQYDLAKNKGYGTKKHLDALKHFGYVKGLHRVSFEPVRSMYLGIEQLKLF